MKRRGNREREILPVLFMAAVWAFVDNRVKDWQAEDSMRRFHVFLREYRGTILFLFALLVLDIAAVLVLAK